MLDLNDPRMIDVFGVLSGIDMQGFSRPEGSDEMPPGMSSTESSPPPAKPSSSEKILRFESSNLGALHKVAFPNYRREHQEEILLHPMESTQQVFSAKSLSMKSHGQNMQAHHLALPDNPRLSQKSNSSIYNIDLSLRAVRLPSGVVQ